MMAVKVVGLGGIGSALVRPLARYLNYRGERATVTLIDGDSYEPKNRDRQIFADLGNKASVTAYELAQEFEGVSFRAVKDYVHVGNVGRVIADGDLVFLAVDNHATRKLVSDYCQRLRQVTLVSGGNELTDGHVQVYVRRDASDVTPPLTHLHPEIESPQDHSPAELSCDDLVESEPQLIFTNLAVASAMLEAFYALDQGQLNYSESYIDILTGWKRPVMRKEVR